jgi:hypothetical protein
VELEVLPGASVEPSSVPRPLRLVPEVRGEPVLGLVERHSLAADVAGASPSVKTPTTPALTGTRSENAYTSPTWPKLSTRQEKVFFRGEGRVPLLRALVAVEARGAGAPGLRRGRVAP